MRQKRQRLYQAGVHVIELDLLRRSTRPITHPRLPESAYLIALTRAQTGQMSVWPLGIDSALPTIPVPLRTPDPDIPLDLSTALNAVYDEAGYDLSINYRENVPPPELSDEAAVWLDQYLRKHTMR